MIITHEVKNKLSCLLSLRDSNLHPYNWNALKEIEAICIYIAGKGGRQSWLLSTLHHVKLCKTHKLIKSFF